MLMKASVEMSRDDEQATVLAGIPKTVHIEH